MRLAEWLKNNKKTQRDFAAEIGISAGYLSQLCAEPPSFWPSRVVAERIRKATCGAVTPNDFLAADR